MEKCDNDRGENLTVYKPRRGVERESARLHRANRYYVLSFRNPGIPRFVTETTSGSTAADYQPRAQRACTRSERRNFRTTLSLSLSLSLFSKFILLPRFDRFPRSCSITQLELGNDFLCDHLYRTRRRMNFTMSWFFFKRNNRGYRCIR